jgi:hypothetical protein
MTPHHPSTQAWAATFLLAAIAFAVAIILSGCAIPIPATGPDAGRYGYINIGYTPNALATPSLTTNSYK